MSAPQTLCVEMKQQTRGSSAPHSDTWMQANWRPFYIEMTGAVVTQLRDSRSEDTSFSLALSVHEGSELLTYVKARNNGGDAFRLQYARKRAQDYHELRCPDVVFVTGEPQPGQLRLWQFFSIETTPELCIRMKLCTNVTSKQHSQKPIQFRAVLYAHPSIAKVAEGATLALPFFARPPSEKEVQSMGTEDEIHLATDVFRPGSSVYLLGDCFKSNIRGAGPRCELRRCVDGMTRELDPRDARRRDGVFITKIPTDSFATPGAFELHVSNLLSHSKVFQVNIVPAAIPPLPVASVVNAKQATMFTSPVLALPMGSNPQPQARLPFPILRAGSDCIELERRSSLGSLGFERRSSLGSLGFERQSSLDSLFDLCMKGSDSMQLERQSSVASLGIERQSSLVSLGFERQSSLDSLFDLCMNGPTSQLGLTPGVSNTSLC